MADNRNRKNKSGLQLKQNKRDENPIKKAPNPPVVDVGDDQTNSEDMWAAFELELKWCIDKLEKQLLSPKLTQKQSDETIRLMKVLSNPKAPLVKKRQTMRTTFGDYRQKMKDEELTFKKDCDKMSVVKMDPSTHHGVFIRKRSGPVSDANLETNDAVDGTRRANNFTFNFVIE